MSQVALLVPQVVGIGMSTLDVLIRLNEMPTWEQGTRFSAFGLDGGGPVATAMVAAARLGARAAYVGVAGTDVAGQLKVRFLAENGLDLSHLAMREGPEQSVIIVCVQEGTGERVFSGPANAHGKLLTPDDLDRDWILSADYLHLDGHHGEAALAAAQWMQAEGKTVVFDGGRTRGAVQPLSREIIRHVDVLICGEGYATALTGEPDLWRSAEAALALGPRVVVQTLGAAGSYTLTAEECFHTPAFAVEAVDTTGAGDVFHGAYIVGLLHGWDLRTTALFSSAVSAMKCSQLGGRAGIPTLERVLVFLKERGIVVTSATSPG
jgi:ribokinase